MCYGAICISEAVFIPIYWFHVVMFSFLLLLLVPFCCYWFKEELLPEWTKSLLHPFPGPVVHRGGVGRCWTSRNRDNFLKNLIKVLIWEGGEIDILNNCTYHSQVEEKVFCGGSLEVCPALVETWDITSYCNPLRLRKWEDSLESWCCAPPSSAGMRLEMTKAAGCRSTCNISPLLLLNRPTT